MDKTNTISIPIKDVYQLLIAECRYGYTRNNHLMPDGAYEKVQRLIPILHDADNEFAINILKQLCEECITDEIAMVFYDGEDDEFGNRVAAIKFVNWCLDWLHAKAQTELDKTWIPYCYDRFLENVVKDDEPRYNVYEINNNERILLTDSPVSEKDYFKFIFDKINATDGTYQSEVIKVNPADYGDRRRHRLIHILTPVKKDFYVEHI